MKKIMSCTALLLAMLMLVSCTGAKETTETLEDIKLTVWNTQGVEYIYKEMSENIPEDWLYEKTGVKVENIYGNDGGQWDSKLTKLVAGDNLPDIVWCQSAQGPTHFNKLDQLGKVRLLDEEMLKTYAPNIWEKTPSFVWEQFKNADGKIIGIPYQLSYSYIDEICPEYTEEEKNVLLNSKVVPTARLKTNLSIRDDVLKQIYPEAKTYDELVALLDEKGEPIGDEIVDVPIHTTEEFIEFMYKIRDLGLVENGKKVYAFGYAGDGNDNWEALVYLGNMMYGSGGHEYTGHWNTETNEVEVPLATDHVRQMAKTQNQMILDKVIDPESLAHTGAQFIAKVLQGGYVICSATRAGDYNTINNQLKAEGYNFKYRPLYIDIPAPDGYAPTKVDNAFSSSFTLLDSLTEEEAIRVLKWADLQYTEEYMEVLNWGRPEDGLYTVQEDGTRLFVDDAFNKYFIGNDSSALDVADSKGLGNIAGRLTITPMVYSKWTPNVYNKEVSYAPTANSGFKFAADSPYVTCVETVPPSTVRSAVFADIEEVVEFWAKREEWEIAIKKAIAAASGQFENKWNEMLDIVSDIVDIDAMEQKMNDIAKQYAVE
ncbi:MAG: extracellular solute-binding protein [Clostridia bacterium]|nr:extracellular solute-binding protein [Clostridia bacterium]